MYGVTKAEYLIFALLLVGLVVLPVFILPGAQNHGFSCKEAQQTTCLSQVRQLAVALQMYSQDHHGRYPDLNWAGELGGYLGNNTSMFVCPSDDATHANNMISYGYSGLLFIPMAAG